MPTKNQKHIESECVLTVHKKNKASPSGAIWESPS